MSFYPLPHQAAADIIGDVHGHADVLCALLEKLGYRKTGGVWSHPESRTAVFVGDLIDGGSQPREVLEIVSGMVAQDHALCVLGNHELNALHHYTHGADGKPLATMSERQLASHEITHQRLVEPFPFEWAAWLRWMQSLPLWLDMGAYRVVHACWDGPSLGFLMQDKLTDSLLRTSARPSPERLAVETLLKGPSFILPEAAVDLPRQVRLKWWQQISPDHTLRDVAVDELPESIVGLPIPQHLPPRMAYPPEAPQLFIGHYGRAAGRSPQLTGNIICVDSGISKGGKLSAWQVDFANFVSV